MTNTDTADADATAIQVAAWPTPARSSSASRSTPTRPRRRSPRSSARSAASASTCRSSATSTTTATLLVEYPETAAPLAKYRINPGNVGAKRHDEHFATIVRVAIDNDKPVRIGVNWGSLDQELLTELMDENAAPPSRATRAT